MTWWQSLDSVSKVYDWIQFITVIFAILTALTSVLLYKTGNRISELQKEKDHIEQERIGRAESATQDLQEQLQQAQQTVRDVQTRQAGRNITADQRTAIVQFLRGVPKGSVEIISMLGDAETYSYANQIKSALVAAEWNVNGVSQSVFTGGQQPTGVLIVVNDLNNPPPHAVPLQNALHSTGIDAPAHFDAALPKHIVKIIIGRN